MNELIRLGIQRECTDLITRYALAVNEWDLDAFVDLFTDDATWQRPDHPPLEGHHAIRAFMESRPSRRTLRHVNGAALVEVIDENTATAWSQTTVYETPGRHELPAPLAGPAMLVEYRDRLRRVEDRWRIARRDTTVVFKAAPVSL